MDLLLYKTLQLLQLKDMWGESCAWILATKSREPAYRKQII